MYSENSNTSRFFHEYFMSCANITQLTWAKKCLRHFAVLLIKPFYDLFVIIKTTLHMPWKDIQKKLDLDFFFPKEILFTEYRKMHLFIAYFNNSQKQLSGGIL